MSSKNSNVKQVKTKNKLTNAHDAAQFGWGLYPEHFENDFSCVRKYLAVLQRSLNTRRATGQRGTRGTRATRSNQCVPCHASEIM